MWRRPLKGGVTKTIIGGMQLGIKIKRITRNKKPQSVYSVVDCGNYISRIHGGDANKSRGVINHNCGFLDE